MITHKLQYEARHIANNVLQLCVRAGFLARMFKVSTAPRLTQNCCYRQWGFLAQMFNRSTKEKKKKCEAREK